jgi:hypothetical protein
VNHRVTACAASFTPFIAPFTMFRNFSDRLYAMMNPATNPAIATTTSPMGFAVMAAFSNHWAPAHAFDATDAAFCTAVWIRRATFNE